MRLLHGGRFNFLCLRDRPGLIATSGNIASTQIGRLACNGLGRCNLLAVGKGLVHRRLHGLAMLDQPLSGEALIARVEGIV